MKNQRVIFVVIYKLNAYVYQIARENNLFYIILQNKIVVFK